MATIKIPPVLRDEAGGNRQLAVDAGTVRDALAALVAEYPSLESRILVGDGVPPFLNVFVDGEDMRLKAGLATEVAAGSTILLLPAVAGGMSSEFVVTPRSCYLQGHGAGDRDVEARSYGHRLRATRLAGPPRLSG